MNVRRIRITRAKRLLILCDLQQRGKYFVDFCSGKLRNIFLSSV